MNFAKVIGISIGTLCLLFSGVSICMGGPAPKRDSTKTTESDSMHPKSSIKEQVIVNWPKSGNWVAGDMVPGPPRMEVYYPKGQSAVNWTEMGTIEYDPNWKKSDLGGMARVIFLGTQKGSPHAKWSILTKGYRDEQTKSYPFTFFRIECPDFASGEPAQVQLWLLLAGKTGLFTVQYSFKGSEIPDSKGNAIIETMKDAHIEVVK